MGHQPTRKTWPLVLISAFPSYHELAMTLRQYIAKKKRQRLLHTVLADSQWKLSF